MSCRRTFKDATGQDSHNVLESLREIKDVILTTSSKSHEDTNSPRGPILSAGNSSSLNSSNRSSPANSSDSSGKFSLHLTDTSYEIVANKDTSNCIPSSKPLVSDVLYYLKKRHGILFFT